MNQQNIYAVKITLFLILISLPMAFGCKHINQSSSTAPTNESALLTPDERQRLEIEAARGGADAAFKLYEYFEYGVADKISAVKWLRVAAEKGHVVAQFNLGYLLAQGEKAAELKEAKKWLLLAEAGRFQRATAALKDLSDKAKSLGFDLSQP